MAQTSAQARPPREYLLSEQGLHGSSPEVLSRAKALEDFSAFEELLKNAYGGYDYFQSHGTDWEGLFKKYRDRLRGKKEWSLGSYFVLLMDFFKDARILDGHFMLEAYSQTIALRGRPGAGRFSIRFADEYVRKDEDGYYLIARSTSADQESYGKLLSVEGRPPKDFLFPTYVPGLRGDIFLIGSFGEKPARSLRCRISGEKDELSLVLHDGKMGSFKNNGRLFASQVINGIPVLTLRTLRLEHATDVERFVATAEKLRREPCIILDLRGNDGGNDGYGVRWLSALTNETIRYRLEKVTLLSPLVDVGEINSREDRLRYVQDPEGRRQIEEFLDSAKRRLRQSEIAFSSRTWEARTFDYPGQAPRKFAGTLIVLSDGTNSSAGESFVLLARSLSRTVVMGENSAGINTFAPVNMYRLPDSGVEMSMGGAVNQLNGNILEGKGILPDLWIDEADMLPAAVGYAEAVLKKSSTTPPRHDLAATDTSPTTPSVSTAAFAP